VPLGRPTVYGLPLGHGGRLATVPLGVDVELDADAGTLGVLAPWFA
jgi:muramoyltetrapeptide carboxypeptidase